MLFLCRLSSRVHWLHGLSHCHLWPLHSLPRRVSMLVRLSLLSFSLSPLARIVPEWFRLSRRVSMLMCPSFFLVVIYGPRCARIVASVSTSLDPCGLFSLSFSLSPIASVVPEWSKPTCCDSCVPFYLSGCHPSPGLCKNGLSRRVMVFVPSLCSSLCHL